MMKTTSILDLVKTHPGSNNCCQLSRIISQCPDAIMHVKASIFDLGLVIIPVYLHLNAGNSR
jgi:hypothetical protein